MHEIIEIPGLKTSPWDHKAVNKHGNIYYCLHPPVNPVEDAIVEILLRSS